MNRRRFLSLVPTALGTPLAFCTGGCRERTGARDGRTTLRYMAWGNPEQIQVERQICTEFERLHPHLHIHLFMVPGTAYADKLQLMLASRTAPDVMRVDHCDFPALVRKEYFLPLDPFIAAELPGFIEDFLPLSLDEGRWEGRLYGLNTLFGGILIYYNRSLLQVAGVPDPYQLYRRGLWTWDRFVEMAVALTHRQNGRTLQFGTSHLVFPQFASVIWNHGGRIMDAAMTRVVMAEDEGAIQGIQHCADLRWKHRCAPTPADNALSPFTFESGKLALNWGWAGASPRYRRNIRKFDWDICPTPSGPAGHHTLAKGNQLVINRGTEHAAEAWKFVKYMTGPDAEMLLCTHERRAIPTRRSVMTDPEYLRNDRPPYQTDVFLETIRRGRILPIDWRYQEWSMHFWSAMEPLFNVNEKDARTTLAEACAVANRVLAGDHG